MLVSAAMSPLGGPARIVQTLRLGRFVMIISPRLRAELDDVLRRPKVATRLDPEALRLLRQVLAAAPVTEDAPAVAVSRDPNDDYLVALAQRSGADCLVSGDKDLTVLVELFPPVRTPASFLSDMETW